MYCNYICFFIYKNSYCIFIKNSIKLRYVKLDKLWSLCLAFLYNYRKGVDNMEISLYEILSLQMQGLIVLITLLDYINT